MDKGRDQLEDPGVDERVIFMRIVNK